MVRAKSALDHYERGLALEDTEPEQAMAAYRRALRGRPDLGDAHCNLGRLLHDRGEHQLARAHYQSAITCDASVALYWFNLGVVLEDLGDSADALAAYQQALALDPRLEDAHFNVARIYEQLARTTCDDLMRRRAIRHLASYRSLAHAEMR